MKKYLPHISITLAVLIWGSTFIVTKTALNVYPPAFLLFVRSLIGCFVLFFFCIRRFKKMSKKLILLNVFTGLCIAGGYLCQTNGLKYVTSAMSSFLETMYLVIVPFISWALTKKKPTIYSLISAFLAVIGVVLIAISGGAFSSSGNVIGVILSIMGGVLFGINIALTGDLAKDKDPIVYTFIQLAVLMVVSLIYSLIFERSFPYYEPYSLLSVIYLGIFATGFAWLFRNYAQNKMTPLAISIILPFVSVVAMIISLIIKETTIDPYFISGAIILLIAIFFEGIVNFIRKMVMNKRYELIDISVEQVDDLLKVYSDQVSQKYFNKDNCDDDFCYNDINKMNAAINFWIEATKNNWFVRKAIKDKKNDIIIGTIEVCLRVSNDAFNNKVILRIDLRSDYESSGVIKNIYELTTPLIYNLYESNGVIIKIEDFMLERLEAFNKLGFVKSSDCLIGKNNEKYENYYLKIIRREK